MPIYNGLASGGSESKTLLWENTSPTSGFSSQTITLSDVVSNYKKLRIEVYDSSGNYYVDYDMSTPSKYLLSGKCGFAIGYHSTNNYTRFGYLYDETYTKIWWSACYRLGATSTLSNGCVPAAVYGIK